MQYINAGLNIDILVSASYSTNNCISNCISNNCISHSDSLYNSGEIKKDHNIYIGFNATFSFNFCSGGGVSEISRSTSIF